jgi:PAS domain S-box-containing protein
LANSISQFAWIADASGSIYWYNQRWYDYTGTTLQQMRGWGWRMCHHPEHVDRVVEHISRSFQTGEPWEDTFPLRSKDGTYRWFLSRAMPVRNRAGAVTHWFGTNTDVSEQRAAQEELRTSSLLLEKILESSTDCIKILDLDGALRLMNAGGRVLMEIDDFLAFEGRPWLDFWQGPYFAQAQAALEAARAGRTGRFQGAAPTAKGSLRWWDVRVTAILGLDGEPQSILSISRDITAEHDGEQSVRDMNVTLTRHLAERTAELGVSNASLLAETGVREAAEAQVRQLQKMEAVGLLTGGIAHDFNNMLAVIIGALNLVERRIAKGQDVQELLDGAMDGAKRAATLTQRLLAFSRQLPLAPEPVNANSLVGSMSEMLRRVLGEATPLETVLAGGLWKTSADPGQLEGAILNLAINARDAMPNGGRLTIETANAHLDDAYARTHTEVSAGQYVMIAVSDTGTGMPPEVAAKAFDPFFTTKGVGKGTGLGLSQVYGFVKQSHGHVKIYTEVGEGTAVKVYLPRLLASTETAAAVPARHHPVPTGTLEDVILVVEDEERMREISSASLRELGYTVLHASSAASALRLLETNPQITVLFTDIVMPDMNGRELADEAVKLRPGLKVLFTTGYTRNAIVHGGRLDAGVNFLAKPFTLDELGQKMSDVIKRR